jgi:hypothetical protein
LEGNHELGFVESGRRVVDGDMDAGPGVGGRESDVPGKTVLQRQVAVGEEDAASYGAQGDDDLWVGVEDLMREQGESATAGLVHIWIGEPGKGAGHHIAYADMGAAETS